MAVKRDVAQSNEKRRLAAKRIRALRAKTGLSQREFARRLEVSSSTVCDWEKGRTRPNAVHLLRFRELVEASAPLMLLGKALQDEEIEALCLSVGRKLGLKRLRVLEQVPTVVLHRETDRLIEHFLLGEEVGE